MEKIQKSYNSVKSSIENKVLKGQINAYEDFPGLKGVSDGTFVIAFLFCNYKNNLENMKCTDLSNLIFEFLNNSALKEKYLDMYAEG